MRTINKNEKIIYLDWNVIVELFEGNFGELLATILNRNEKILIPYSNLHIMESQKFNDFSREYKILEFISKLSCDKFLDIDQEKITENSPEEINENERFKKNFDFFDSFLISNSMQNEIHRQARELGFNNVELNNFSYDKIIAKIDELLSKQEVSEKFKSNFEGEVDFSSLLYIITNKISDVFSSHNLFQLIYKRETVFIQLKIQFAIILLDAFGYWMENQYKTQSFFEDSRHVVAAAYCDYFITNDKKLYKKCLATYYNLGVATEVYFLKNDLDKIIKLFY